MDKKERLVVIGGGFAGLNLLKYIDKSKYEAILVDRNNFHSFPPLFYQIASSGLEAGNICFPFRREMRKGHMRGTSFHLGEVKYINTSRREVVTQFESIPYDRLVIAAGTTNNFFGNPDLEKYVYTLKSTAQALRIRDEVLDRLERASICRNADERRRLLSFVVIGGGPAGVEVAGALGEMKRYIIPREYPGISPDEISIILLEGSSALLSAMSEKSHTDALSYLGKLMVEVRLNTLMNGYHDNIVSLSTGEEIYSAMVIWTAGVTGVPFMMEGTDIKPGHGNRFEVDEFNRIKGIDRIYAIGDIALMCTEDYPHGHPQLAQAAIQQGRILARNLNIGRCEIPFRYVDKGSMATVGRNLAVADLKHTHLSGWIAWMAWMMVHLLSILGMRNKLTVLINWSWSYFTYATSLRLLVHTARYPLRRRWGEV
ncbi:MAG: NAD(P)/FAD-dependent oxidoreductase [Muribaculaceae bacterium]|nr:NAD(P)/FAD-dependent oxidoreductase [Muribaculaceae bacterium]